MILKFKYIVLVSLAFFAVASSVQAQSTVDFLVNGSDNPTSIKENEIVEYRWSVTLTAGSTIDFCIADGDDVLYQFGGNSWRIPVTNLSLVGAYKMVMNTSGNITAGVKCYNHGINGNYNSGSDDDVFVNEDQVVFDVAADGGSEPPPDPTPPSPTPPPPSGGTSGPAVNAGPADGADNLIRNVELNWSANNASYYDVFFGKISPPQLVVNNYVNTNYNPGLLEYNTTYYWRIVTHLTDGEVKLGSIWSFSIKEAPEIVPPPSGTTGTPPPPTGIEDPAPPPPPVVTPPPPKPVTTTGAPTIPTTQIIFALGDRVRALDIVNVRSTPSTEKSTIIRAQLKGAEGNITGGPRSAANLTWWQVDFDSSPDGWVSQDWIVKVISLVDVIREAQSEERISQIVEKPTTKERVALSDTIFAERASQTVDKDGDSITDYDEVYFYGTDPESDDTDGDGMKDKEELLRGINPTNPSLLLRESGIIYHDPRQRGEEKPELFSVDEVTPGPIPADTYEPSSFIFKGTGPPNSIVTLYFFSTPIIVTVETDADGNWVYELDRELDKGNHEIYVAITDARGGIVAKGSPVPFVKEAQAIELGKIGLNLPEQEKAPSFFNSTTLGLTGAGMIVILVIILVVLGRKRREDPTSGINIPNFPG
ncbi:MAG: hypothetical protein O2794_00395 [bacterium]|nr:hypothetical protein [bacterium]